jgi:3-hydroxybutyryl-CoA dehydrogenase
MTKISRVGVVGAGLMGSGIAEVCARAGLDVVVADVSTEATEAGRRRVEDSMNRARERGKLAAEEHERALANLRYTQDLDEFADREVTIEAVTEDEELKTGIFARLDKAVRSPDAILASNTSSIPIMKLGMATARPEHVVGIHFFNPVPVQALVEVVPSLLTGDAVADAAAGFAEQALGKTVIRAKDRAGFVVNALLVPYLLSAIRMLESGFASAEDIDRGMVLGCAHPMGPLRLTDLIGLDTTRSIAESLFDEFKEPLFSPPPLLLRMVEAGLLGRKSGRGFYQY